MNKIAFFSQDFERLKQVEEFNTIHWKGPLHSLGWNYDIGQDDQEIAEIRESLRQIQNKLDLIRSEFAGNPRFKGFKSSVQKITQGMTNRYHSHLWLSFINELEEKPPNEPQLQVVITLEWLDVSLWYENGYSVSKYFKRIIDSDSEVRKAHELLLFEIIEEGTESKIVGTYSNKEWEKFVGKMKELEFKCKVGLRYRTRKDDVISQGDNIIHIIDKYFKQLLPLFDLSSSIGERFIIAHIEWNDEGWTAPQIPDKPAFKYVKDGNIPHDSLTFKFDKPIDSPERVHGYFQPGRGTPRLFIKARPGGRFIFFMSRKKIVGIYGDAEFMIEPVGYEHPQFENGRYLANISGNRGLSLGLLMDCYLKVIPEYMNEKSMGQSNFIYITEDNARRIMQDVQKRYEKLVSDRPEDILPREHLDKIGKILRRIELKGARSVFAESSIVKLAQTKRQVILYGPPGTGKTFMTKKLALSIIQGE